LPNEIAPLLTLLIGAALIFAGGRLARRISVSETIGYGVALCTVAVVLGLSPAAWRAQWAGGEVGDRLLTYARLVGLTGLLFLAGNKFSPERLHTGQVVSFGVLGVLLFTMTSLILTLLFKQPIGIATLIAATVVSSSVWLPAQFKFDSTNNQTFPSTSSLAVVLTATALLGFHLINILAGIPASRRGSSIYLIVTLYELVKIAVVFAFAYFICTLFVARAAGRISPIRTNVAFILIAILCYALISLVIGPLGAIGWAFFAGALWRRTNTGGEFSKRNRPLASALVMSMVFLSLPLQSHGREFAFSYLFLVIAAVTITAKLVFASFMSKTDANTKRQPILLTAIAFPGEIAILFLSFSMTRWYVDGSLFFAILIYGLASCLLIPISQSSLAWGAMFIHNSQKLERHRNEV